MAHSAASMNVTVKTPVAAHAAASEAQSPAGDGPSAHPKIARRPSQWKQAKKLAPESEAIATLPAPLKYETATPWQEDTRFGAFLLIFILLLNAALLSFSDGLSTSKTKSSLMIQQVTRASALPDAHVSDHSSVRLFANPNETYTLEEDDGFERFDD